MALPIENLSTDSAYDMATVHRRLRWLVAVHLVVSLSPAVTLLVPDRMWLWLHLALWAVNGIPLAEVMLLAFWAGLGTSPGKTRLVGAVLGSAYVALGPNLTSVLAGHWEPMSAWFAKYLGSCVSLGFAVFLGAGICLLIRRRIAELCRLPSPRDRLPRARPQFSIRHLLVVTSVVAILLGLASYARVAESSNPVAPVAYLAFLIVGFLIISMGGAWAALGLGRLRWRLPLVLLVTFVLAIAMPWASQAAVGMNRVRLVDALVTSLLFLFTLMAVFVGSLLVVRSCGYRLISKSSGQANSE